MNGQLFTQDFLARGIVAAPAWQAVSAERLDAFIDALRAIYAPLSTDSGINEAITESEVIFKVIAELGWREASLPQVGASGARREDVPDMLLFPDAGAKAAAMQERKDDRRYRHGVAVLESKRWMRPLDRGEATNRLDPVTPSNQILRYLSAADVASDHAVRWGILTNGAVWRLYYQGARSRSEDFLEIDLGAALEMPGTQGTLLATTSDARHQLQVFLVLFSRSAFIVQDWDSERRTLLAYALAEARQYEEQVSQDLGARVFGTVFPDLADALAAGDPQARRPFERSYLEEVREAALILLYRLLFVLYAEDRELLPIRDRRYSEYSLRRLREEVRDQRDSGVVFSETADRLWGALTTLFRAIAGGDSSLGLPAYNGGLFEDERTPLLARARLPDAKLALAIDELSRRGDVLRAWINYRDLSVQHLGGIYERLLEYRLEERGDRLVAQPTSFARRGSGSYYTHDDLVKLLIAETIGPLAKERAEAFDRRVGGWKRKTELRPADWDKLDGLDPASGLLDLKVCDPAMGSGHFLVALVDDLADRALESMASAAETVASQRWARDAANPWVSPVTARIADIRERILAAGAANGWTIDPAQLDDRHVIRRMILKRVIHGVDKNPMAVELAKVALWLHTFTVGAPLSFLDHHLRCGDSLAGEHLEAIRSTLAAFGVILQEGELDRISLASRQMGEIADLTDIDIAEAHHSKALLETIDAGLAPLKALQDFWRSLRWLMPGWPRNRRLESEGVAELLSGRHNLVAALHTGQIRGASRDIRAANALMADARVLAERERFFHWATAFPMVWRSDNPSQRGFDAIVGNPPWDRMKLQQVEWFAERRPEIAQAVRASDRKALIASLEEAADPLWQEYVDAQRAAETSTRVARESGDFPLLSGGDINLYSLFVERAAALVHGNGIVGLLTPSGIAADRGAAEFFRGISTTGRLASLFDFENRGVFFPDIDDRFKFCSLIFGGVLRRFAQARCAFYLHDADELAIPDKVLELGPEDFRLVNPNTGAAPIFRTRRDCELTMAVYRRQPVLVDRRGTRGSVRSVWRVRYHTMFHMTSDSEFFLRRDELEHDGWYKVDRNRWKKGDAEAFPLYEGKMVQMYDHRAASVVVHADNLHRAAQQEATTLAHHQDPGFYPTPQFWVPAVDIVGGSPTNWAVAFKDVTSPTNVRTMIAAIVPSAGYGNTLPLLLPEVGQEDAYRQHAPLLLANLCSMALDYVARQKVQGQHLNWFIVEQLPMIRPDQFEAELGGQRIGDFVRAQVLRLSYTAEDLRPFALDLGYEGPPFAWDDHDRRHRIARLDAMFFHLYGLDRGDADYVLDTFPIIRQHDEALHGRYVTKELVLAYMNAIAAGDLTSEVAA